MICFRHPNELRHSKFCLKMVNIDIDLFCSVCHRLFFEPGRNNTMQRRDQSRMLWWVVICEHVWMVNVGSNLYGDVERSPTLLVSEQRIIQIVQQYSTFEKFHTNADVETRISCETISLIQSCSHLVITYCLQFVLRLCCWQFRIYLAYRSMFISDL